MNCDGAPAVAAVTAVAAPNEATNEGGSERESELSPSVRRPTFWKCFWSERTYWAATNEGKISAKERRQLCYGSRLVKSSEEQGLTQPKTTFHSLPCDFFPSGANACV